MCIDVYAFGNYHGENLTLQDRNIHPAAASYLMGLTSEHSKRNMRRYLNQIAHALSGGKQDGFQLDWSAVRYEHARWLRAEMIKYYAPATVNVMLSALRGVLKECFQLGLMSADDLERTLSNIKNVKNAVEPAGRDLSHGEIQALVRDCMDDKRPAGVRDAAIIGILYTCGLRRAELVAIDINDFDTETRRLLIRSGKGRKDRSTYVEGNAWQAVVDWLQIRGECLGALFVPILKSGRPIYREMTSQAIYNMLSRRAKNAGVENFSPHDLRRTFVGDMLDEGVDISTVAKIAGHASTNTTTRYDRRGERVKKEAARRLHFPYIDEQKGQ